MKYSVTKPYGHGRPWPALSVLAMATSLAASAAMAADKAIARVDLPMDTIGSLTNKASHSASFAPCNPSDVVGIPASETFAELGYMHWPISAVAGSPVGECSRDGGTRTHDGRDFAARIGTPVFAAYAGKVSFKSSNCGGTLYVDHGHGYQTRYIHVKTHLVRLGDQVAAGKKIAEVERKIDCSSGPHLHFEIRRHGRTIDWDNDIPRQSVLAKSRIPVAFGGLGAPALTRAPGGANFDANRRAELVVFRPSQSRWYIRTQEGRSAITVKGKRVGSLKYGARGDIPVPADYTGNGRSEIAVFRPGNGRWYRMGASRSTFMNPWGRWGNPGDIPVPGNYGGDRLVDLAVYRPVNGRWYVRTQGGKPVLQAGGRNVDSVRFGAPGDIPVPADYTRNGKTDIAVFRPSTGQWLRYDRGRTKVMNSWGAWGNPGDIPVRGDYDGDGRADLAVYRPSNGYWYVRTQTGRTLYATNYGNRGDVPVPADYDNDGKTDLAILRPSNGRWYMRSKPGQVMNRWGPWGGKGDRFP